MNETTGKNSKLILAAMIFAVSMTFIDQTIVAISLPTIQGDVHLSTTGSQWIINGYLLSLSALFAFGGRLADIAGHRRMVVIGVIVFAVASALCGATPTGSAAEAWLIVFRIIQGAGAALMFPAALAIVLDSFPVAERGRAMAIFFGIAGGLTSIGPIAGGYLTEWTWRSIFWINIPVAIIALFLTWKAKPAENRHPGKIDYKGTVLVCGGMGLLVLGLQQSAIWGWGDIKTWASIVIGIAILVWFVFDQLNATNPLLRLRIFENRAFAVDSAVLFFLMIAFVPLFFFASEYAQISLGESASETGLYLLIFFAGFATATQWGGKMLDRIGARRPVVMGCAIGAVGFYLWGKSMTHLSVSEQWYYIVIAGIGVGLVLSPANTDALNRVSRDRYGEATGITQTVRNFGSSLGLAILGSLLITWNKSNLESILGAKGVPKDKADAVAECVSQGEAACQSVGHALGSKAGEVFSAVPIAFAEATRDVFYGMAVALAIAFVIALKFMPSGKVEEGDVPADEPAAGAA
ncbi:MAG TPA: MFS transporter [Solirubrobacterales bacterium]|jgi:EmrB/QacA subfamily drug resistance transporter|nr:MFS transporter [Solirubrobacterales bacterium]